MEDAKEEEENLDIADMDLKPHHLLVLTIVPKGTCRLSKENDIVLTEGEQIIDVPYIDFVLRDQQWKLEYCDLMIQILHM